MAIHDIAVRDGGGDSANNYVLVFGGDHEPENTTKMGASSSGGTVDKNGNDNWRVRNDAVWGGTDAWTYSGGKIRMAFDDPDRVDINVNNNGWYPATDYNATETLGDGSGGGGDSGGDDTGSSQPSSSGDAAWKDVSGPIQNTRPRYGLVDRRPTTVDHETVFVTPNGDFGEGAGTKSNPFGSLQDAFNYMPVQVRHTYKIKLLAGHHDSDDVGSSFNVPFTTIDGLSSAKVIIEGNTTSPSDHHVHANQINLQMDCTVQDFQIEGVHVHGTLQSYRTKVFVDGCVLEPNGRWGNGHAYAMDFYGGKAALRDCSVVDNGNTDAAFNFTEMSTVMIGGNVNVDVDAPLGATGMGGGFLIAKNADINADSITSGWEPAPFVVFDHQGVVGGMNRGDAGFVFE
jgi:hypothetical protein